MTPHPEPQTLAAFLDGTLDDATRREVADHIETCDECLTVIGETARMLDEEEAGENVVPMHGAAATAPIAPALPAAARPPRRHARRWMYVAAAIAIIAISATFIRTVIFRDPVDDLIRASRSLATRPVEGRLAGFDYARYKPVTRGSGSGGDDDEIDAPLLMVASDTLEKNSNARDDARRQHASGVAALLAGHAAEATAFLQQAATLAPHNARYANDLAVALSAARRNAEALAAAKRAIALDPQFDAAVFNEALILDAMGRDREAAAAYDAFLARDASSPWAADARKRRDALPAQRP